MNPPASVQLLTVNRTKTIKTAGRAVIMHWLQYHYFTNSWICQQATCTAACYGVSVVCWTFDDRLRVVPVKEQQWKRADDEEEQNPDTKHRVILHCLHTVQSQMTSDVLCRRHALKRLTLPETCASRLVTETCTCISVNLLQVLSCRTTSLLHTTEHSSITALLRALNNQDSLDILIYTRTDIETSGIVKAFFRGRSSDLSQQRTNFYNWRHKIKSLSLPSDSNALQNIQRARNGLVH